MKLKNPIPAKNSVILFLLLIEEREVRRERSQKRVEGDGV